MYEPKLVAPVPPPRRRGLLVALIVGLVPLVCCGGGAMAYLVGRGGHDSVSTVSATPRAGDAVRDGQFEFVVGGVSCGHAEIVNGFMRAQPQGRFCIVELTVRNVGRDARTFADGNQRAYSPGGDRYAADTGAGWIANSGGAATWNVVNPGNSVRAKVVFDIPPTASISTVELHDSLLSGGVRVAVDPTRAA